MTLREGYEGVWSILHAPSTGIKPLHESIRRFGT
jgi:hypothetical protein